MRRKARAHPAHARKPVVARVTAPLEPDVISAVERLASRANGVPDDGAARRRRAGFALALLCAASSSLVLLAARSRRAQVVQ